MTTHQILELLSKVKPRGADRWCAQCPAHEDRDPSMTIRQLQDRTLCYCWAGCSIEEIVSALGIQLADLYHDRRGKPDPVLLHRRRAAEGLETWRQSEIRRCGEDLRTRDAIIRHIGDAVDNGVITEDEALPCLADEYRGYSELEYRFERLLRNENVLEVWRESWRKHDQ